MLSMQSIYNDAMRNFRAQIYYNDMIRHIKLMLWGNSCSDIYLLYNLYNYTHPIVIFYIKFK
jgi:hypothetical protein